MTADYTIDSCPECGGYLYPDSVQHECIKPARSTPEGKWCWWREDHEGFRIVDSESEAHGEAAISIDNDCMPGDERTYIVARVAHPMDYVGIDWIARHIANDIEENICCWCDDNTGAEDASIELTKEDGEELGKMVADFVRKKASVNWWTAAKGSETKHSYVAGSNNSNGGAA